MVPGAVASILVLIAIGGGSSANVISENHTVDITLFGTLAPKFESALVLNCTVVSAMPALFVASWDRYGQGINDTDRVSVVISGSRVTTYYTFSRKPEPGDEGNYTCLLRNTNTESYNRTTYILNHAPYPDPKKKGKSLHQLKDHNKHFFINESLKPNEDDNAAVHCHTAGFPAPRVTWHRVKDKMEDDTKLIGYDIDPIQTNGSSKYVVSSDGSVLTINKINRTDRGFYVCLSKNSIDPPMYIYTRIRVKDRLAPLWPVLALLGEILLLGLVIGLCELRRKRSHKDEDDNRKDGRGLKSMTASTSTSTGPVVRHRSATTAKTPKAPASKVGP